MAETNSTALEDNPVFNLKRNDLFDFISDTHQLLQPALSIQHSMDVKYHPFIGNLFLTNQGVVPITEMMSLFSATSLCC